MRGRFREFRRTIWNHVWIFLRKVFTDDSSPQSARWVCPWPWLGRRWHDVAQRWAARIWKEGWERKAFDFFSNPGEKQIRENKCNMEVFREKSFDNLKKKSPIWDVTAAWRFCSQIPWLLALFFGHCNHLRRGWYHAYIVKICWRIALLCQHAGL